MKTKDRIFILFILFFFSPILGMRVAGAQQFENSQTGQVNQNSPQTITGNNHAPPGIAVLEKIKDSYYEPILQNIEIPKRNRFVFLSSEKESERISRPLNTVSLPPEILKKMGRAAPEEFKLETRLGFPLESYFFLLEKIKSRVPENMIAIGNQPLKVVPKDKKLQITVIFKSTDEIQPDQDVESYAVVYLDKKKVGVTEQKLLSQSKSVQIITTYEKHLLGLEVYIQDPLRKAWRRLRNIEQPSPKYLIPDPDREEIFVQVTYYPERRMGKYEFEGSFYKQ